MMLWTGGGRKCVSQINNSKVLVCWCRVLEKKDVDVIDGWCQWDKGNETHIIRSCHPEWVLDILVWEQPVSIWVVWFVLAVGPGKILVFQKCSLRANTISHISASSFLYRQGYGIGVHFRSIWCTDWSILQTNQWRRIMSCGRNPPCRNGHNKPIVQVNWKNIYMLLALTCSKGNTLHSFCYLAAVSLICGNPSYHRSNTWSKTHPSARYCLFLY